VAATPVQIVRSGPPVGIPLKVGYGVQGGWYEVYFTDPSNPFSSQRTGGVDGPLGGAIASARQSVDIAACDLTLISVRDALIAASRRGVEVRAVMESDHLEGADPQLLVEAGIQVVGDQRQGLMHDSFIVIDRSEVWTGSMDFTESAVYEDHNTLFRVRSSEVAENYTHDFEEMFINGNFGPEKGTATTPHLIIRIDGTRLDNYFSPAGGAASRIIELLKNADESIHFLAYSFTNDDFGKVLSDKADQGLSVSGVMDQEQAHSSLGTEYDPLRLAGIDVRLAGGPGHLGHQVLIIDGKVVILGSYGFSRAADNENDENVLIIFSPQIAQVFLQEFQRVYAQARYP